MAPHAHSALKQEIIKTYNAVNQEMYVVGVSQQRVEIIGDKILIIAEHKRLPILSVLDEVDPQAAQIADVVLVKENKRRLALALEITLGVKVRSVLKDYDPHSTLAATVIILDQPLPVSPIPGP